jgi:hypothetical protein
MIQLSVIFCREAPMRRFIVSVESATWKCPLPTTRNADQDVCYLQNQMSVTYRMSGKNDTSEKTIFSKPLVCTGCLKILTDTRKFDMVLELTDKFGNMLNGGKCVSFPTT